MCDIISLLCDSLVMVGVLVLDNFLDKIGISATSICAIHCILLPIILPALPLLGLEFLASDVLERTYLLVTVMLGFIALYAGFKRYHRKIYPFYLLALGAIIFWFQHELTGTTQVLAIIAGATLVVIAHLVNIKLCNSCRQCESEQGCS